jgi:hypothetical protein
MPDHLARPPTLLELSLLKRLDMPADRFNGVARRAPSTSKLFFLIELLNCSAEEKTITTLLFNIDSTIATDRNLYLNWPPSP